MKEDNVILRQLGDYLRDTFQEGLLDGYPYPNVASGALFNSIESVIDSTLQRITITTHALYYAKYVNQGRKAGEKGIPLEVIHRWIRQRKMDLRGKREQSVAFAIQMSIKLYGIPPTRFIDEAEVKIENSSVVDRYLDQFIEKLVDAQLNLLIKQITSK